MKNVTRRLLNSVKSEYSTPYKLKKRDIDIPIQLDLIGAEPVEGKIMPFSGYCFEMLANIICSKSDHHANGKFEDEDRSYSFMPDLIYKNGHLTEVKSCKDSDQLKFRREQMAGYISYQLQNNERKVDFVLFSHDIEGIRKEGLTRTEYLKRFRENVLFGIKVPLAIPMQFYIEEKKILSESGRPLKLKEYSPKKRTQIRGYANVSVQTTSSVFLRESFGNPENMIRALHLDTLDFKDPEKYMVKGTRINGNKIKPFPFLELQLKDEEAWVKRSRSLLENFLEESEILKLALTKKAQDKEAEKRQADLKDFNWATGGYEDALEEDEIPF